MTSKGKHVAVISSVVLLIAALIIAAKTVLADVPVAIVKGSSMLPLLREGDIVFIAKAKPDEIAVGDIIVYMGGNRLIVHRVVNVKVSGGNYYYVTRGDNNPFEDIQYFEGGLGIPYSRVVGKVVSLNGLVFKVPYIGSFSLVLRDMVNRLLSAHT